MWDFLKGIISSVFEALEIISAPLLFVFSIIHLVLYLYFSFKSVMFLSIWFGLFYVFTITVFYEVLQNRHQRNEGGVIKEGQKHIPHHIAYCARCGRHIGPIESYINGEIIICHDCLEENKKPKKQIIAEIRKSFELFGLNTSEFTDDELEKSITEMTKLIMKTGVSIKQANDAFLYLTTNNRQT